MTDFDKLKRYISQSGMPMTLIAKRAGISRETLYNRLKGVGEFTSSEIVGLASTLRLSKKERDAIFFNN